METKAPKTAYFTLLLYGITLVLNILFLSGRVFPYDLVGYLNQNPNPLLPWMGTFLIWPLLLIGLLFVVLVPLRTGLDNHFRYNYQLKVEKKLQIILLFQIVLVIIHGFGESFPTLLLVPFYINQVDKIMQAISSTPSLRRFPYLLKWPVGLLYGWSIGYYISFAGMYTSPIINKFSPLIYYGGLLVLMVGMLIQSFYSYIKLGNEGIIPGLLWYLLGLSLQYFRVEVNPLVPQLFEYIIAILLIVSLIYYLYLIRLQVKQRQQE